MNSLDPRVNRLPRVGESGVIRPKAPLDQFGTYEVFVQPRDGKPFQHEGAVHAPNLEMAFVLAKEAFTRRFLCNSLYVAETRSVFVSPMMEEDQNVYDLISAVADRQGQKETFEIYHLLKRGKQHIHAGTIYAGSDEEALSTAKNDFKGKVVLNVWAIRTRDIRFTSADEKDLWNTLPEKKFRDASDYRGGEKLKEFLERNNK